MRGFGWRRCASTAMCALLVWAAMKGEAHAALRVHWDCFLPDSGVGCSDVANAYFPSVAGIHRDARATSADMSVVLRYVALPSARRFVADFRGRPVGAEVGDRQVRFTLARRIPTAAGHDHTLMLLVALLQRGTVPYLAVTTPGTSAHGVLHLEAAGEDRAAGASAGAATAQSGWYLRPSLSGQLVSAGVHEASVSSDLELSYSSARWRWLTTASGSYQHLDVDLGNGHLTGGFVQAKARSILARALGPHLDVALVGDARRAPQNNLLSRLEAGVGLEWMHRAVLRAEDANYGARFELCAVRDRYATETVLGQTRRLYVQPSLGAFARWHLSAVDLEGDVAGELVADQPKLWDVSADLKAALRLTANLEIDLSVTVIYRGGAVHQPADPSKLDPVATVVAGSDFGTLTYQTGVSLAYTFGNSLLHSQDQRWR